MRFRGWRVRGPVLGVTLVGAALLPVMTSSAHGGPCWARTYGTPLADSFAAATMPDAEGFTAAGVVSANPSLGTADAYLARIDAFGNLVWAKSYGGPGFEAFKAIRATADGGYLLGGSQSSWTTGSATANEGRAWIVKTDSAGNTEWATTVESFPTIAIVLTVAESLGPDGKPDGYLAGGWGFGHEHDGFVMKLDLDGRPQWKRIISSEEFFGVEVGEGTAKDFRLGGYDEVHHVKQVPDGFVVTGYTQVRISESQAHFDPFVAKLGPDGTGQWIVHFGGGSDDYGAWADLAPDGDIVATGHAAGFWDRDPFVVKLAKGDGTLLSQRIYHQAADTGHPSNEHAYHIHTLADGYVVGGSTHGKADAFVFKVGPDLEPLWEKTISGSKQEEFFVAHPFHGSHTGADQLLVAGHTYSVGSGSADAWALKLRSDGTFDALPGAPAALGSKQVVAASDVGWTAAIGPAISPPQAWTSYTATPVTGIPVATPGLDWDTC